MRMFPDGDRLPTGGTDAGADPEEVAIGACDACLRRTWLLQRLGGYLDFQRRRIDEILNLADQSLIDIAREHAARKRADDRIGREYAEFGPAQAEAARARSDDAGLELICRCNMAYPERLLRLSGPPAVLFVAGGMRRFLELIEHDPVAIVGTRRATSYGTEVAGMLGRGISASGMTVVSGMAMGIDAAAHRGAVAGGGRTIAILPSCAADPYPKVNGQLYRQILRDGVAVGELGLGAAVRRWTLIARNRIIAALSVLTVVVQGREGSGALLTAALARRVGGLVGAVPGSVLVAQSEGPHDLIRQGALLVRGPQDILDGVFGAGARAVADRVRARLSDQQRAVLDEVASGADTIAALSNSAVGGGELLTVLATLELAGCLRRAAGGRYVVKA